MVGLATRVEVVAEAWCPRLKVTGVVSWALPSVAVMVSVACAEVDDSVVVNTPCALVVPEVAPKMIAGAAARQRHGGIGNEVAVGILDRHRQRGGRHPVRGHRPGLAAIDEFVAEAVVPALKVTGWSRARCLRSP